MSAHASQAFSIAHCTDSEDLPLIQSWFGFCKMTDFCHPFGSIVQMWLITSGNSWIWPHLHCLFHHVVSSMQNSIRLCQRMVVITHTTLTVSYVMCLWYCTSRSRPCSRRFKPRLMSFISRVILDISCSPFPCHITTPTTVHSHPHPHHIK